MYCSNCGRKVAENSRFCSHCGYKLPETKKKPVDSKNNEQEKQQSASQESTSAKTNESNFNSNENTQTSSNQQTSQQANFNQNSSSNNEQNNSKQSSFSSFDIKDKKPSNNNSLELVLKVFSAIFAVLFAWQGIVALFSLFRNFDFSFYIFRYYPLFILNIPIAVASSFMYFAAAITLLLIAFERTEKNTFSLFVATGITNFIVIALLFIRQIFNIIVFGNIASGTLFHLAMPIICTAGVFLILCAMQQAPFSSTFNANTNQKIESCIQEFISSFKSFVDRISGSSQSSHSANYQNSNNSDFNHNFNNQSKNQNDYSYNNTYSTSFYGPVKQDRSLIVYIILNFITCGIYGLYFIYSMAKDVNRICCGDGRNTTGLIGFIFFNIITCGLYSFYWYYSIGNRLADNAPRYSMSFREDGTTVLLWMVLGSLLCGIGFFIGLYFIIKNLNTLSTSYNNRNF